MVHDELKGCVLPPVISINELINRTLIGNYLDTLFIVEVILKAKIPNIFWSQLL